MKKAKRIVRKATLKAITFVAYSVLSVFHFVLKALCFVYRFTAVPLAAIGLLLVAYDFISLGFDPARLGEVIACLGIILLHFAMPYIQMFLSGVRYSMKSYLDRPIIVRHRYRFSY